MHPEDAPEIGRCVMQAVADRTGFTVKGRYRTAGDGFRILQTDAQPRFSAKGEFLGMIGVNVDVTERESAEAALRRSEEQFRLAVEAAPSGMVMADADGRIVTVNGQAEKLFGYRRAELIGRPIELLVPERFRTAHPGYRAGYGAAPSARPMGAARDLFALHKDGSEFPVEIGLSPFVTSKGLMTLAAVVDISARKRAEAQRELLIAELNHRVKNTLAVIHSIAHQTFKGDRATPEAKAAFEGRLIALASAHDLLTQSNWESASLSRLATSCLPAYGAMEQRISLSGPDVLLPPRQALALALALHELYTNAAKHGALSNDTGRVALEWSRRKGPAPKLEIVWREQGGPHVNAPTNHGFGSILLERVLHHDLRGDVTTEFRPDGLVCSITAPLAQGG
jgi:PAS domain S-box-containing protein